MASQGTATTTTTTTTHHRTCCLCEAMCGLEIEVDAQAGRVKAIRGDAADSFSQGYICPKAVALQDLHEDPDRLRRPLRRDGSSWTEVSWDAALDDIARRVVALQAAHGKDAMGLYVGNPIAHSYSGLLYGQLLADTLGSKNRYSANSVDALPHLLVAFMMFGHQALLPVPDLDRVQHLLVLGANPVVSNGSVMSAPGMPGRLKALRARGGKLIVIDPRRSETAELADQHHFIKPGTDALLLLGMLHTLFDEKLARPGRLDGFSDGLAEVRALALKFPPERVALRVGIAAPAIRGLARDLAASPAGAVYGRLGVSVQEHGALACWLINVVNIVTGNLDRVGGVMFTRPAVDGLGVARRLGIAGEFAAHHSRVRGLPAFTGEFPVAVLGEEMDTPGPGQLRGLITFAGNPVLSAPNGPRIERALAKLDLMVSIDIYRNETTRHAHYILPPVSALERDHFDLVLSLLTVRNVTRYSEPLFTPPPGARHDWEILNELSERIERRRGLRGLLRRGLHRVMGALGPTGVIDLALRAGPYGLRRGQAGLSLRKLRQAPHGLDLGALEPMLPARLQNATRRIQLAPPELLADAARLDALVANGPEALSLIGRRHLRSNNSWMHNAQRLVKGPDRCTLLMHPADAAARGFATGQKVRVTSRVGTLEAPLEISDEVMSGVVSLPHGWGHARTGMQLGVATAHAGVSINDVTDELRVDALAGTAAVTNLPVDVTAAT